MARLPYTIPYDPDFLGGGYIVPLPSNNCTGCLYNQGRVIDYIHFSLVMHQDRKSALYTAHNIDISQRRSVSRTSWDLDPRINNSSQTGNEAYANNPWDRGHLVRKAAVSWGSGSRAKDASDSTFYFTNAALQHSAFNQSNSKWLGLEDWVLEKAGDVHHRMCVFTGPIYTHSDDFHRGFRIPSAFFKIVVLRDPSANGQDLSAMGFVMSQNEGWRLSNGRTLTNLEPYLIGIEEIEAFTGLNFGSVAALDEFNWRAARFRDKTRIAPLQISGPEDIEFNGAKRRRHGIRASRTISESVRGLHRSALSDSFEEHMESHGDDEECTGCAEKSGSKDQHIRALHKQLDSLTSVMEDLIEENNLELSETALTRATRNMARVVGGQRVPKGAYPSCVAVGSNTQWFCTGVLIHKKVVLTAAHCTGDIKRIFIGGRQVYFPEEGSKIVPVSEVHTNPDYFQAAPWHDIAVLILEEEVEFEPVLIADKNSVDKEDTMNLVGFGSDDPNGVTGYGTKREALAIKLPTNDLSEDEIRSVELEHGFTHDYEFHVGSRHQPTDTCYGDSGGPVYLTDPDGKQIVAGLTSRGASSNSIDCGQVGIYTRIHPYLNWISEVTGGLVEASPSEGGADIVDTPVASSGGVFISAAMPNPSGHDRGNEWIEIQNNSFNAVNLSGYTIRDKQGGRHELGGVISPNGTRKFILPSNSSVKLGNKGDEIILTNENGTVHEVDYDRAGSGQVIRFSPPDDLVVDDDIIVNPNPTGADPC